MTDHDPKPMDLERRTATLAERLAALADAQARHQDNYGASPTGKAKDHAIGHGHACEAYKLAARMAELDAAEHQRELDEARAEVTRLRARVRVEAEDVERAGVTKAHVEAWLAASPNWNRIDDGKHATGSVWQRKDYPLVCPGLDLVGAVRFIAGDDLAAASGILDEMAAMPTPDPAGDRDP